MMSTTWHKLRVIKSWWRILVILLTPLIMLPLPLYIRTIQARCAYIVLLLIVYWVSEAAPYAVTSLLPLVFFPMAGVLTGEQVGLNYFHDITTLLIGCMMLAHTVEHVRLHQRLALLVLKLVGTSITWSMAGLMGVSAFMSMWISNLAATSIMIPAAIAIVDALQVHHDPSQQAKTNCTKENFENSIDNVVSKASSTSCLSLTACDNEKCGDDRTTEHSVALDEIVAVASDGLVIESSIQTDKQRLKAGFLIAVAFGSAIGGFSTLVGCSPNILLKGYADEFYATGTYAFQVSFSNFLGFALPIGIVMLILCWLMLQILFNRKDFLRCRKADQNELSDRTKLKALLEKQYKDLGPLSWQERIVSILFVLVVVLWVTRDFSTIRGWGILFRIGYVTDGTVAMLIGSLPLLLPNANPFRVGWTYHPILSWNHLSREFPWGVFMLQGAGLAIANAFTVSDLSGTVATFLQFMVNTPQIAIIFLVIVITVIFTEFINNLACASIMFPILDSLATMAGMHPARLIIPSCMAASLSFMLPIATPPNAMIFSTGHLRMMDLLKTGLVLKIIGVIVTFFASLVLLPPIFHTSALITSFTNSTAATGF